ncbi:MAG: cold shock protein [Acidimicrobiaceae bacterium]|jgi:CspA family cold shock protein
MAHTAGRWVAFETPETSGEERIVQGVVKSYDPGSGDGVVLCDTDLAEYDLDADALLDSVFRMLRQGQRVIFDVTSEGLATRLRLGSEVDMGTPGFPPADSTN